MPPLIATVINSDSLVPLGAVCVVVCGLLGVIAKYAWTISRGVARIEDGLRDSWTQDHQREWSMTLANRNPEIDVPDSDAIVSKQRRPTGD
jgi:hypothetical protein